MIKKIMGVYKITSPTGRIYIGSSVNIDKRFKEYKRLDGNFQIRLYRSFRKYGVEAHKFEIITECSRKDLRKLEGYYGNLYNVLGIKGLNCRIPKLDDVTPAMLESTKRKIGEGNRGKVISKETREKLRNANLGKKHSEETKEKMRASSPHRIPTKENVAKMTEKTTKLILDFETGIFYNGTKEASEALSIKRSTLIMRLLNRNKNLTSLRYV